MTADQDDAKPKLIIRLTGITKAFPGIVANDAISLDVFGGEVHCLLGENGAGKSTLISVLAGLQQPDSGRIEIDGHTAPLRSPRAAAAHGIGVVYQHSTLVPSFTVLENLMLGSSGRFWLDRDSARARLAELSALLGVELDAGLRAGDLGLGQQQQVEIAKAMWLGSRVLILDEPTSMLTPLAIEQLVASLRRIAQSGVAVLFVSHKLREVFALSDRVTVLRGGRVTDRILPAELRVLSGDQANDRVQAAMFGTARAVRDDRKTRVAADAPVVLEMREITTVARSRETRLDGVSLSVRSGEIVGVAGIDGQGQQHLAEALAGQISPASGEICFDGHDITATEVRARQLLGVRYVTDNRLHEGIVAGMSVAVNLVLKRIGERPFWVRGRMNRAAVAKESQTLMDAYDIRAASADARAGTLSGGNIQKMLLARELAHDPRVVVFHKPSYGLDLNTVTLVHERIRAFVDGGGAAVLISNDLDELIELSDRIVVMAHGRFVREVPVRRGAADGAESGSWVVEQVGAAMMQGSSAAAQLPGARA